MNTDPILQLQEPFTDGGIRAVNFFNGRLLTGKDLSREQEARREADARLGLALGDGVAFGLEVSRDAAQSKTGQPVLRIEPGLALNRKGQTLRLLEPVSLALTRSVEASVTACLFSACQPIAGGSYVAGAGLYLLTIAPAAKPEGRAADSGLDPANPRCNTDATVEAVQFRLLPIKRADYADLDVGAADFRNAIAYRCFGAGVQSDWFVDLLGATPRRDDLLERLRPAPLTDQDVLLALLFFTGAANLDFIDMWAARRPLSRDDTAEALGSLGGTRRIAVGQAMFRQFQQQVAEWAPYGELGAITARSHCRYLPPVGIIPVPEETDDTDAMATRFFNGMTCRGPVFINGARLEAVVRDSFCYPPVDAQGEELVWLYRVAENRIAINSAHGTKTPGSYLAFASGHLPYAADARYDLARFDYSNYALVASTTV